MIENYDEIYRMSIEEPEKFWADAAQKIHVRILQYFQNRRTTHKEFLKNYLMPVANLHKISFTITS